MSVVKNIWSVLLPKEKQKFTWLACGDIIISVLDILALVFLVAVVQLYTQPQENILTRYAPGLKQGVQSSRLVLVFFGAFVIKNIAAYLINKAQSAFNADTALRISADNLIQYQQGSFENYVETDSSKHIRKIAFYPIEYAQHALAGMQQFFTQFFLVLLSVTALLLFNADLFLLVLAVLIPPAAGFFYYIRKRMSAAKDKIKNEGELSYQYLSEALQAYQDANVYQRNEYFLNRYLTVRKRFVKELFSLFTVQTMPARAIEIFAVLGLVVLIMFTESGTGSQAAVVTIGAFMAAAYKIIPGTVKLINISGQLKLVSFSREERQEKTTQNSLEQFAENLEHISVHDLALAYKDKRILENISFDIRKGDFVGITGISGKGKTSLMNALLGFLAPFEGEILFNNQILNEQNLNVYRSRVAYVRQQAFLIHDSVEANITFEKNTADKQKLESVIHVTGLRQVINGSGADKKKISENGRNISGGQQQRVALARALYKDADLIVLDEPFNELDTASSEKLLSHFKGLTEQGKMVIMVTHDKSALRYCNKTVSLDA